VRYCSTLIKLMSGMTLHILMLVFSLSLSLSLLPPHPSLYDRVRSLMHNVGHRVCARSHQRMAYSAGRRDEFAQDRGASQRTDAKLPQEPGVPRILVASAAGSF